MKAIKIIFYSLIIYTASLNCSYAGLISFVNTTLSSNINGFYVYTPDNYDQTTKKYPLLINIHGLGENGTGQSQLNKILSNGPLREMNANNSIPGLNNSFIVVCPQFKTFPYSIADIDLVIDYINQNYRVRSGREYLVGYNTGGVIWDYVSSSAINAQKSAAVVIFSGIGTPTAQKGATIASSNLPVWAFHNIDDQIVSSSVSINYVNFINNSIPAPNPLARLTTSFGVGHVSWIAG